MKNKIILLLSIVAIFFSACNPLDDIEDALDKSKEEEEARLLYLKDRAEAPEHYTLTEEDYALSSNESVKKYKNFSASNLPKDYLPEILNQKFSGEDAQSMKVTYDYYSKPYVDKEKAKVISEKEYAAMGQKHDNFGSKDEAEYLIGQYLDDTMYPTETGVEQTVKYVLFKSNQSRYIKVNSDGSAEVVSSSDDAVEVTDAQYEATGNGKYKNFFKVDTAIEQLGKLALEEGTAPITYKAKIYQNFYDNYSVFMYNGENWEAKQSLMPVTEELNFALNSDDISQSTWWADPAIKYTIKGDDWCIEELQNENCKYKNFDIRSGKADGDRNKLITKVGYILENHFGDEIEDGQQYLVTYAYYDGSSGTTSIRVARNNGTWSEVELSF